MFFTLARDYFSPSRRTANANANGGGGDARRRGGGGITWRWWRTLVACHLGTCAKGAALVGICSPWQALMQIPYV